MPELRGRTLIIEQAVLTALFRPCIFISPVKILQNTHGSRERSEREPCVGGRQTVPALVTQTVV